MGSTRISPCTHISRIGANNMIKNDKCFTLTKVDHFRNIDMASSLENCHFEIDPDIKLGVQTFQLTEGGESIEAKHTGPVPVAKKERKTAGEKEKGKIADRQKMFYNDHKDKFVIIWEADTQPLGILRRRRRHF